MSHFRGRASIGLTPTPAYELTFVDGEMISTPRCRSLRHLPLVPLQDGPTYNSCMFAVLDMRFASFLPVTLVLHFCDIAHVSFCESAARCLPPRYPYVASAMVSVHHTAPHASRHVYNSAVRCLFCRTARLRPERSLPIAPPLLPIPLHPSNSTCDALRVLCHLFAYCFTSRPTNRRHARCADGRTCLHLLRRAY